MRIETIETVKNIIDQQKVDQSAPQWQSGEIFSAEVAEQNGDFVLLRRADGWAFMARVMREMGLQNGDKVEVVVKEVVDGKQIMQVLDIEKGEGQAKQAQQQAASGGKMIGTTAKDPGVQTQMLLSSLAMLKQNQSMTPKMATFFSQNSIPNTPENVAALAQMASGAQTVQTLLIDLVLLQPQASVPQPDGQTQQGATAAAQPQADAAQAAQAQTPQAQAAQAAQTPQTPQAAQTSQTPQTPQAPTEQAVQTPQAAQTPQAPQAAQAPQAPADASVVETSETAQQTPEAGAELAAEDQAAAEKGAAQTKAPAARQGAPVFTDKQIANQISALFARLGGRNRTGAEIKKDVATMPAKLRALTEMLSKTESKDKDTLAQKAGAMEKQFSLMAEAKRFFCMQFPFVLPDETPRNAELFVYRDASKKTELDAENIVILLGLDTQNIGRVETLINVQGKSVSLKFHMSDPAAFGDVRAAEKTLAAAFKETGYRITDIGVSELEQRTNVLNAESVLAGEAHAAAGEVDIRI